MILSTKEKRVHILTPNLRGFFGSGSPKPMQFLSLLRLISGPNFKEKIQFVEELSTEKENV